MAIDQRKFTTALRMMSDEQLQQTAQLHQNDPYMFPLAFQESQERKALRSGMMAEDKGGGMPPPIKDQALMAMGAQPLPEEVGIGALPMESSTYAEGGIVAFAEGGTFFPEDSLLGMWERYQKENPGLPMAALFSDAPEYREMREAARSRKLTPSDTGSVFVPGGQSGLRPDVEPPQKQPVQARSSDAPKETPPRRVQPPVAPATADPLQNIYQQYQDVLGKFKRPDVDPFAAERAEILKSRQEQAMREQTDAEQRAQGIQSLLKPREERISQREAALQKQGEIDRSMAIINAGLAMMQSTGGGLSGIAEGAAKGMKQYGEALALSKAERQKISDARDAYDEFKLNAQSMSQKEITAAKNKFASIADDMTEKAIAARQTRLGESRTDAKTVFDAMLKQQEAREANVNRLDAARIVAAPRGDADTRALAGMRAELAAIDKQIAADAMLKLDPVAAEAERRKRYAEVAKRYPTLAGTIGGAPSSGPVLDFNTIR